MPSRSIGAAQLTRNTFGVQGTSLASLFDVYGGESRFPNARRAGSVVQKPVVQGVVRSPVVLIARSGQRDSRWVWFRLRPVVPRVIPFWRGSRLTLVVQA